MIPRPISRCEIVFTHTERVVFPEAGWTKGDVIEFYRGVAPVLLPFLKDRPITLERLPSGIHGPRFWQKNTPKYYPEWISRINLPSQAGKPVEYALIDSVEALLFFVNQGAMTFHIGFSRIVNLERPDFVLFDLDPGHAPFTSVVAIARELASLLKDRALAPVIKTSGKTGIHVFVPWGGAGGFDEARAWALEVAEDLVRECGSVATIERSKERRKGKVYIDVMQNALGHHAVPPYVLRAVPQATVSMPISISELTPKLHPTQFDLGTALMRLSSALGRELAAEAAAHLLGVPPVARRVA